MAGKKSQEYFATRINTRFLRYITPEMAMTLVIVGILVYALRSVFIDGFTTNIGLNGTIVSTFFYTVYLIFKSNYEVYKLSLFVKSIEDLEITPHFSSLDVKKVRKELTKSGHLIDTQSAYTILSKMVTHGFFFPNDDDARVLKSTLGNRVSLKRGHANFLSSILVTLGLIGTFWGLIITISAIGGTMTGIAASFSSGADLDLGALIEGISKPLGGMGVAFSSSLYGLAGSLVVGVLSTLANKAQNRFMDSFARWIDEHIPEINFELAERIGRADELPVAVNQDQNDLIKAYVILAQQTHTELRVLSQNFEQISQTNAKQLDLQAALNSEISSLNQNQQNILERLDSWANEQKQASQALSHTAQQIGATAQAFETSQAAANASMINATNNINDAQERFVSNLERISSTQTQIIKDTQTSFISSAHNIIQEQQKVAQTANSEISAQLQEIIKEQNMLLKQSQKDLFTHLDKVVQQQQETTKIYKEVSKSFLEKQENQQEITKTLASMSKNNKEDQLIKEATLEISNSVKAYQTDAKDIVNAMRSLSDKQSILIQTIGQDITSKKELSKALKDAENASKEAKRGLLQRFMKQTEKDQ